MKKKISVIVPVYKVEKYLENCIESILAQTYREYELLLIDDGSPDSCGEICDKYAFLDDRIRVVHKPNGGLSSARNAGLDVAKGEYISFVDSDDTVHPEFLETLLSLCEKNGCQISMCDYLAVELDSIRLERQPIGHIEIISSEEAVERSCSELEPMRYTFAWNKLYRKDLFENFRYPVGKLHEDDFTTYLLLWKSNKVAVSDLYLYWYLQRPDSIMGRKFNDTRLDRLEAFQNKLAFLKQQRMDSVYNNLMVIYYRLLWATYEQVRESMNNGDSGRILETIEKEARHYEHKILAMPGKRDIDKVRLVYPHQADAIQERYRMHYGVELIDHHTDFFLFPFNAVPQGSRIAIYGAGMVGRVYYIEVTSLHYGTVTLWVDRAWNIISRKIKDVKPVDALFREKTYDCVVIAVRHDSTAQIVIDNLISWGMPREKIVWKIPSSLPRIKELDIIR